MLLSRHQNAGQYHNINTANRYFENAVKLRYLGKTVISMKLIRDESKRRLRSSNACYPSDQYLLFPHLLSKNYNTRKQKLCLWFCCRETWSLILKEEHTLMVLENRMLRRIFWPKRDEIIGWEKNCIMRKFITFFAKYNSVLYTIVRTL
jgi:hypothetical protein